MDVRERREKEKEGLVESGEKNKGVKAERWREKRGSMMDLNIHCGYRTMLSSYLIISLYICINTFQYFSQLLGNKFTPCKTHL